MKTIICLVVMLAISNYAISAVCTAPAASFCQTCDGAACNSCYNWGVGTNKDKIWATSTSTTCTGSLPAVYKVANCKSNNIGSATSINATTTSVATTTHPRCIFCDSKKYLVWADNATAETCTDTQPTNMTTCVEISGCMQTRCQTNATQWTSCAACDYDKYPTGISTTTGRNTSCGNVTTAITNCYLYGYSIAGTTITYTCSGCKSGFAVSNAGTSCVAYSDNNCQSLQVGDALCQACWYSYYFNGAVCIARSYVGFMIGLIAFVTLLLVQ